jgi:hypothetical protein
MFPPTVVTHRERITHVIPRVMACGILARRRAVSLETANKPCGHRLVQPLTVSTHATVDAMGTQPVWLILTGLWTAARRMRPQARSGVPPSPGPPARLLHPRRVEPLTQCPAHDLARRPVSARGHRQPARGRPHLRALSSPHGLRLLPGTRPGHSRRRHGSGRRTVGRSRTPLGGPSHRAASLWPQASAVA